MSHLKQGFALALEPLKSVMHITETTNKKNHIRLNYFLRIMYVMQFI